MKISILLYIYIFIWLFLYVFWLNEKETIGEYLKRRICQNKLKQCALLTVIVMASIIFLINKKILTEKKVEVIKEKIIEVPEQLTRSRVKAFLKEYPRYKKYF